MKTFEQICNECEAKVKEGKITTPESYLNCLEFHADGVKEVKCDFCEENCGNDWCPTKDEQ